jgi:hypothetical protein
MLNLSIDFADGKRGASQTKVITQVRFITPGWGLEKERAVCRIW